jgi:hypothetical protein
MKWPDQYAAWNQRVHTKFLFGSAASFLRVPLLTPLNVTCLVAVLIWHRATDSQSRQQAKPSLLNLELDLTLQENYPGHEVRTHSHCDAPIESACSKQSWDRDNHTTLKT